METFVGIWEIHNTSYHDKDYGRHTPIDKLSSTLPRLGQSNCPQKDSLKTPAMDPTITVGDGIFVCSFKVLWRSFALLSLESFTVVSGRSYEDDVGFTIAESC